MTAPCASTVKKSTKRRYSSPVTDRQDIELGFDQKGTNGRINELAYVQKGPNGEKPRPSILSLSASELEGWLAKQKVPAYRRKQIWSWFGRGATTFDAMDDLPKPLRAALERDFRATSLRSIAVSRNLAARAASSEATADASSWRSFPSPAPTSTKSTGPSNSRTSRANRRAMAFANAGETQGDVTKSPRSPMAAPRA